MDPRAKEFVDAYYCDYIQAVHAVTEVFKAWGQYELSPANLVQHTFLLSGLTYVEHCGERVTDDLATFIMDVCCFIDDEITEWIHAFNADKKREIIFDYIETLSQGSGVTLDNLSQTLKKTLDFCRAYDDAANASTCNGLVGALTRFAYLLITTDDRITRGEESFYEFFRVGLSHALNADLITQQDSHIGSHLVEQGDQEEDLNDSSRLEELIQEVNSLIGLSGIKSEVADLVNLLKVQQLRKKSGLATLETSKHMVFYGNPGTGKTTVARKLAQIYKILGFLSKGHLIEADRSTLVAGYLGQTALKTKQVLDEAKGGILFIDEAYTLSQGGDQDQYGQESIDTILKYMEDNREDIVIVVAGYEEKMSRFINSNPGLKSRFSRYFHFPDYSAVELVLIFIEMAMKSQYHLTPAFKDLLDRICEHMVIRKGENFGNGRTIRNLFEKCISNQANRVVLMEAPSNEQLMEMTDLDISLQDLEVVMR